MRFTGIRDLIDKLKLQLSKRTQKKELRQLDAALIEITFTFLNRYEYKHGYVRPCILSEINAKVLDRLKNKTKSQLDDYKPKLTTKGLIYHLVYQTCTESMNSYHATYSVGDHPETLLELIQFSLKGLNHEKITAVYVDKTQQGS